MPKAKIREVTADFLHDAYDRGWTVCEDDCTSEYLPEEGLTVCSWMLKDAEGKLKGCLSVEFTQNQAVWTWTPKSAL